MGERPTITNAALGETIAPPAPEQQVSFMGKKVLLAVPTMGIHPDPDQWLLSFVMVIEQLKQLGTNVGVCFPYRMNWEQANNLIIANADNGQFDYILRMDDDVHGVPPGGVIQLFSAQKPVIGAIYPMRHFPFSMTAFRKKDPTQSLEDIFHKRIFGFDMAPEGGIQKVDLLGFGLTLIDCAAIKHIPRPIFTRMVGGIPDDSVFCQRCADHGVELYAHMDVRLNHRHVTPYNNLYLNNAEARNALRSNANVLDKAVRENLVDLFGTDGQKDLTTLKQWRKT